MQLNSIYCLIGILTTSGEGEILAHRSRHAHGGEKGFRSAFRHILTGAALCACLVYSATFCKLLESRDPEEDMPGCSLCKEQPGIDRKPYTRDSEQKVYMKKVTDQWPLR